MATTQASEWRKNRETGVELILRSGNTARIRAVGVDLFIRVGRIPDFLTPMVLKALEDGHVKDEEIPKDLEHTKEWIDFLDSLMEIAFVEPPVVKEVIPGSNAIAPDDIAYEDKLLILGFLGRPVRLLEFFRDEQAKSLATLAAKPELPQDSQPTPEN